MIRAKFPQSASRSGRTGAGSQRFRGSTNNSTAGNMMSGSGGNGMMNNGMNSNGMNSAVGLNTNNGMSNQMMYQNQNAGN